MISIRSMPMPMPAGRRHAVLQRPQEVLVQLHGLGVAARGQQRLRGQPGPLLDRVDQFGVARSRSRCRTRPGPTSRPAAGRPGAPGSAATPRPGSRGRTSAPRSCSRPGARTSPAAPGRGSTSGPGRSPRWAASLRSCSSLVSGVTSSPSAADTAPCTVSDGHSPPMSCSPPSGPADDRAAEPGHRGRLDQLPGQRGHRGVVAVRLVRLEHRELGVVRGVRALVAEVPAELVDLLDAADDQPLEVELQRDPQVHGQVVGVDVGDERPGVGAAVQRLQHRGLDLEEPALVQFLANRPGHRAAQLGHLPGLRVDDQVHVALPHPGLPGRTGRRACPAAAAAPWR